MSLKIPCPHKVDCVESPLANLTSEAPDSEIFISVYFPPLEPPLGRWWVGEACGVTCTSPISQEAANLCAAQRASICVDEPPPRGDPPGPVCKDPGGCTFSPDFPPPPVDPEPPLPPFNQAVCNEPQTACVVCPDGTQFCYTVQACTFYHRYLVVANAIALDYAQRQADLRAVCMTGIVPTGCAGQEYFTALTMDGGTGPFTWSILSGALPAGITGAVQANSRQFVLSGTTAALGSHTFTIRSTDSLGNFVQKVFTIPVVGILTSSITSGEVGVAYAFQLEASGGVTQGAFSITSGSLPDGLAMGAGGLISGTPTTSGDSSFTVTVVFANGVACSKNFGMTITDVDCIILTESIPAASQNQAYSFQMQAGGGTAPFIFAIIAGSLPAGLSLSAAGLISGTPSGTGLSAFTIEATDANLVTCDKDFTLNVFAGVCGTLSINAIDMVWADSGFSAPSSGTITFTDGANATFSMDPLFPGATDCDQEGQWIDIKSTICNPGGGIYSIRVTIDFAATIKAQIPACPPFGQPKNDSIFLMIEKIGGASATYQAGTTFGDLVIPGGGTTSGTFFLDIPFTSTPQAFQIRLYLLGSWGGGTTGTVSITPQTHP